MAGKQYGVIQNHGVKVSRSLSEDGLLLNVFREEQNAVNLTVDEQDQV